MASQESVGAFLRSKLGYDDSDALRQLDAIAGQKIARTRFLPDLSAVRGAIQEWMPVFFLPIAQADDPWGLHLRPADVQARRLAVLKAPAPGEFVEIAATPGQVAYLALLGDEGYGNGGKMLSSLPGSVAATNKVFGADFYKVGRHGNFQSGDEPLVMIDAFGGTPAAFATQAALADDDAAALPLWQRGVALGTGSLKLHAGAARALLALGRREDAARHAAQSLDCYHHTAHDVALDDYFEEVRPLLDEFPKQFSEDAAWQLREGDPRKWARRAADLFKHGEPARADKLLNDVCHGTGDYPSALGAFRQHYAALGWDWALALCDLRA
jgi:hypothetical protein